MASTRSLRRAGRPADIAACSCPSDIDTQTGLFSLLPQVARRRALAGRGGRRDRRRARNCGGLRARRGRGPDRHGLFAHARRRRHRRLHRAALAKRERRRDAADQRVHRPSRARPRQSVRGRGRADVRGRAAVPLGGGRGGAAAGCRPNNAAAAISRRFGRESPRRSGAKEGAEALTRKLWADGQAVMTGPSPSARGNA